MMKKILFVLTTCFFPLLSSGQSRATDISVGDLPGEVKQVLEQYIAGLRSARSLDQAAENFAKVAGGSLVNEDPENITLRNSVKPYSLKKDFENVKFYAEPIQITRVNCPPNLTQSGFGASAIKGKVFKIWIAKADGQAGLPAPVSILVPEGHSTIKTPKVINIGSL